MVVGEDADGGGEAGVDGHLDVAIVVADEQAAGEVEVVVGSGAVDHFRAGFSAGAVGVGGEAGAGVDGVEGGVFGGEGALHLVVDLIQIGLGHEAFADALLAGDEDGGVAPGFAKAEGADEAGGEMEIVPGEDVAGAWGEIDDAVAVEEDGRAGCHGVASFGQMG